MSNLSSARSQAAPTPLASGPQRTQDPAISNALLQDQMRGTEASNDFGFLDGLGDIGFGSMLVDHTAELTTEDTLPGRRGVDDYPKRWEDGTLRVPRQAQRELRANALQNGDYRPLNLQETDETEAECPMHYFDPWGRTKDCATATYTTLERMGYQAPKGDKLSVMKAGEIGRSKDGRVSEVNEEAARKLLDTIDGALLEGTPAMVGVDYHEGSATNRDQVTDHWFTIVGRTYDEVTGEVRYIAVDNADQTAPMRYFTVGDDYSLTSLPPEGATGAAGSTYTATNARIPERKQ
ncbi:MAG: hypothetical protein R3F61_05725 [Myxococcota bacterium]